MPAMKLHHYNVWSKKPQETIQFYTEIIGLTVGPRPPVGLPGAWLYDTTGTPVLHLVDVVNATEEDRNAACGRDLSTYDGSGSIDHVAFESTDFEGLSSKLNAAGIRYREDGIPAINLRQIFVNDPNGIQLELNFLDGKRP